MIKNGNRMLEERFTKLHDKGNASHSALFHEFTTVSDQSSALETLFENPDLTITQKGNDLLTGRAADKLRGAVELARKRVDTLALAWDASIEAAMREHSGLAFGPYAVEIRDLVRSMTLADRIGWLKERIASLDAKSLAAVLLPPPYLSGLTEEIVDDYTEIFYKTTAPKLLEANEVYQELATITRAGLQMADMAISKYGSSASNLLKAEAQINAQKAAAKLLAV